PLAAVRARTGRPSGDVEPRRDPGGSLDDDDRLVVVVLDGLWRRRRDVAAAVAHMMLTEALIVGAGFWIWRQRLRRALVPRRPPPAPPSAGDGRRVLPVAVIVPARNEARNLPRLLDSLQRLDPAPAEIIVVDDHSNDGTGSLARAPGARDRK